jgi:hypothetical protein
LETATTLVLIDDPVDRIFEFAMRCDDSARARTFAGREEDSVVRRAWHQLGGVESIVEVGGVVKVEDVGGSVGKSFENIVRAVGSEEKIWRNARCVFVCTPSLGVT